MRHLSRFFFASSASFTALSASRAAPRDREPWSRAPPFAASAAAACACPTECAQQCYAVHHCEEHMGAIPHCPDSYILLGHGHSRREARNSFGK